MTPSADYDAGLRHPWVVSGDGGSWSITATDGSIIASEIPHGAVADYIADLHNTRVIPPGECPGTKFPDGTRCGEYGWHASDCPARVTSPEQGYEDVVGPMDGYRPTKPLPPLDYDEYAERGDPR